MEWKSKSEDNDQEECGMSRELGRKRTQESARSTRAMVSIKPLRLARSSDWGSECLVLQLARQIGLIGVVTV
uniref:Uncharacterized protein n=1 Tax=Peronospora matthiolae TaxID=2874970 RepID=A0AAV1V5J8_9STRA